MLMTIKTLVVHLSDDEASHNRFHYALSLAKYYKAHLMAVYITVPMFLPEAIEGRGASYSYIMSAMEIAHEKADAAKQTYLELAGSQNISCTWYLEDGEPEVVLSEYGLVADLIILGQMHSDYPEDKLMLHVTDSLAIMSASPVLLLPHNMGNHVKQEDFAFAQNILVAWKATKESTHAVRQALPLLEQAQKVTILHLKEETHLVEIDHFISFLNRHDIKTELVEVKNASQKIGEVLLQEADNRACDLLVMGAYGHSRWRELVFGGTTRYILNNAKVPVFMAH